jgi:Tol biopolymer transport system component
MPSGLRHYSINVSVPYEINGPWQVTWTPPLATSEPTPTPAAGACLTLDKWNQLSARNDPLPSGLGGQIVTTVNEGGLLPVIYVGNLDGTNSRKIDVGASPSLSSDGTRLAYGIGDGIHIFNLSSGESPAVGIDGYRIIWSPDNTRMMFTTTFSLNVVNADGSNLQKIDTGTAQVISPAGWLPDNQTIIYSVMGGDGFTFTSHNLQSGEKKKLFTIQNKAGFGAVSPDGQWISFADKIFGANNWGIFISHLDSSERKLIAEPEVPTAFASVWSPDSQWLVIRTQNKDESETPILVNPFTCQSARLSNINGSIEGWSP